MQRREVLLPGCVTVALRTLDPSVQVRILARQPPSIGHDHYASADRPYPIKKIASAGVSDGAAWHSEAALHKCLPSGAEAHVLEPWEEAPRFSGFSPMLARMFDLWYTSECMKLIAQVKLHPSPEQHTALLATLAQANAACDTISAAAWQTQEFRRLPLQKLLYHSIKDSFRLGAQILVRCIAKVADAYKLDRKVLRTFQPHGAVPYDARILSFNLKGSQVSIWTLCGRLAIPFVCGERQRESTAERTPHDRRGVGVSRGHERAGKRFSHAAEDSAAQHHRRWAPLHQPVRRRRTGI